MLPLNAYKSYHALCQHLLMYDTRWGAAGVHGMLYFKALMFAMQHRELHLTQPPNRHIVAQVQCHIVAAFITQVSRAHHAPTYLTVMNWT